MKEHQHDEIFFAQILAKEIALSIFINKQGSVDTTGVVRKLVVWGYELENSQLSQMKLVGPSAIGLKQEVRKHSLSRFCSFQQFMLTKHYDIYSQKQQPKLFLA